MSDATDDLDYANSGLQAKFRKIDKELWEKQKKEMTQSEHIPELPDDSIQEPLNDNPSPSQGLRKMTSEHTEGLDDLIETIWLRALDMTSDDFDTDEKYEKAKANYSKHNKKLLEAHTLRAVIKELKGVQLEYGGRFGATTYVTGNAQSIQSRLAELQAKLNKLEGKSDTN